MEAAKSFPFSVRLFGSSFVRCQIPLLPAYSLTLLKSQGQTIIRTIIDPSTPPGQKSGPPLTLNELYVGFSRSSGRDSIRLLHRLPDNLAQKLSLRVPHWLGNDDQLLSKQAKTTRERFENGILFDLPECTVMGEIEKVGGTSAKRKRGDEDVAANKRARPRT